MACAVLEKQNSLLKRGGKTGTSSAASTNILYLSLASAVLDPWGRGQYDLLSGSVDASDSTGFVQPCGKFGKCTCDKQLCMEREGFACHILILQTLQAGIPASRYNKALIFPRKMLLKMHKHKI